MSLLCRRAWHGMTSGRGRAAAIQAVAGHPATLFQDMAVMGSSARTLVSGNAAEGKPKVLVLAGPTAVGKSATAMRIAEMVDGEIISADSVQIYQGLDIGSAKPNADEQAMVPHHLIDELPFTEQYNAAEFALAARAAIADVVSRGKVPLVVGGTAFYLKSLVDGMPAHGVGNADPATAAKVEAMVSQLEWEDALTVLSEHDPEYASKLYPNDWRRLIRCLEVNVMTGQPMPVTQMPTAEEREADPYDFRCIFMTAPRVELVEMIDNRCEVIVETGLVEETLHLLAGGMEEWTSGARAVGYRQALDYLKSDWFTTKTRSPQGRRRKFLRFVQKYQGATRRFARKQQAWFRNKEPNYWWIVREQTDQVDEIAEWICDRFTADEWTLPSAEINEKRAEADRQAVARMNMAKHRSVNILYADNEALDFRIASIRAELIEAFPELNLDEEEEELEWQESERVRKQERKMSDDYDRGFTYEMPQQSRGSRGPRFDGSQWGGGK